MKNGQPAASLPVHCASNSVETLEIGKDCSRRGCGKFQGRVCRHCSPRALDPRLGPLGRSCKEMVAVQWRQISPEPRGLPWSFRLSKAEAERAHRLPESRNAGSDVDSQPSSLYQQE